MSRVYISDPPLRLSSTIASRRSTLPLYLPSATKATVWQDGKKRGFLSRGRARYPYLGRQLVSVLQWMPMGRTPCRISMTTSRWVCTGRAHGPPSQKGWEQSPSSTLHPTTKAFYWFIWMIIGQKAERAPMSKQHKLWRWLCGHVMHVHGSVKFCYSQTKPVEDCRSIKTFRTFKEFLPGKVILANQYFGPCPQCQPFVIKYCTGGLKMSFTSQ